MRSEIRRVLYTRSMKEERLGGKGPGEGGGVRSDIIWRSELLLRCQTDLFKNIDAIFILLLARCMETYDHDPVNVSALEQVYQGVRQQY